MLVMAHRGVGSHVLEVFGQVPGPPLGETQGGRYAELGVWVGPAGTPDARYHKVADLPESRLLHDVLLASGDGENFTTQLPITIEPGEEDWVLYLDCTGVDILGPTYFFMAALWAVDAVPALVPPLRARQRDDGQGPGGHARARGTGSRQRSTRQKGYL